MNQTTTVEVANDDDYDVEYGTAKEFLTITIGGQLFGIPVLQVEDVLGEQSVTEVPLSPPAISGSLNLRGRIVTAINVRKCLHLEPREGKHKQMSVVVEQGGELYSLIIDEVGDVLNMNNKDFENNPATLDPVWKNISLGIYKMDGQILVILDVPKLIDSIHN